MRGRSEKLDLIKGILVLLVVIGHCTQYYYIDNDMFRTNYLFNIIYSFHMPVFIATSGFATAISSNENIKNNEWIKKRFNRLVVPFLVWAFLAYFFRTPINKWSIMACMYSVRDIIIVNPSSGGMWFLWTVFLESLVLWILMKFFKSHRIVNKVILLCMIFSVIYKLYGPRIDAFGIWLLINHFFSFFAGYLIGVCNGDGKDFFEKVLKGKKIVYVCITIVFLLCIRNVEYGEQWPMFCGYFIANINTQYIIPAIALVLLTFWSNYIHDKHIRNTLGLLGKKSLEIYVIHLCVLYRLLYRMTNLSYLEIFIKSIFIICACLIISSLIEKNKWCSFLLLGKLKY